MPYESKQYMVQCVRLASTCIYIWGAVTDKHQRYQTSYTAPGHVMASSAMRLNLGVFGFLPTTHAKANAKQMRSRSSRAARLSACDCFHAQPAVHAINLRTWRTTIIFITGKTRRPPNWAPCQDQDGAGSGISGVYLWVQCIKRGDCADEVNFEFGIWCARASSQLSNDTSFIKLI